MHKLLAVNAPIFVTVQQHAINLLSIRSQLVVLRSFRSRNRIFAHNTLQFGGHTASQLERCLLLSKEVTHGVFYHFTTRSGQCDFTEENHRLVKVIPETLQTPKRFLSAATSKVVRLPLSKKYIRYFKHRHSYRSSNRSTIIPPPLFVGIAVLLRLFPSQAGIFFVSSGVYLYQGARIHLSLSQQDQRDYLETMRQ